MANQIYGRKFSKMPESYQAKMKEAYGDQAKAEHQARGEAQSRWRDGERVNYKVKDGNWDEFVTSGNARMGGAGGASSGEGDKAGRGKNRVSALDFKNLYKQNLAKGATYADKVEMKRGLVDWGRGLTPEFEKGDVSSVQAAGYGGTAQNRLDKWARQIAAFDETQKRKDKPEPEKEPMAPAETKPSQSVTPRPGGGNNSPTQGINVGDIATGDARVGGRNNDVNTGVQDSFNQKTTIDNSRVYEGDDRNFTKIVNKGNYRDGGGDIYAPKAEYETDYSDATMAGLFQPSDSPAASQKFLAKYMDGLKGSADDYSDALYNLKRNYADNLAMIDYATANDRMNQIRGNFGDRAELQRLESQPSAEMAFEGLEMGTLPKKEKDETKEIYESFG